MSGWAAPRIESLEPRRSLLSRPDVGNRHRELPIAANVDLGVIVAACTSPPLRPGLIDRYLIALEHTGVSPPLCINKIDLCKSASQRSQLKEQLAPYRELGLPMLHASTETGTGTQNLAARLAGKTAVLIGHSGVGKSSLLGALGC
jgi:ribosome biogenesis GTPase